MEVKVIEICELNLDKEVVFVLQVWTAEVSNPTGYFQFLQRKCNFPSQVILDPHLMMLRAECDSVILDTGLSDRPKNGHLLLPGDQIACITTSAAPLLNLEIVHPELPVFSPWRTIHSASSEAHTRRFRHDLPPCTKRRFRGMGVTRCTCRGSRARGRPAAARRNLETPSPPPSTSSPLFRSQTWAT